MLVVKFVGKNYPPKVRLSPPIMFRYWFGNTLETMHGSSIGVRDSEFGIYPKTDASFGAKVPQVAF